MSGDIMEAEPSAARKEALVVLGMHRSGTSAMARVLSLAGATLPSKLMLPGEGNAVGHWEPLDIQEFNDTVLDALDSDWSDTFGPRQAHQRKLPTRKYVAGARALIQSNYDGADFIVLKEPRISILMDLWKEALAQAGYSASFVIMVRHPLEVAESLKTRNGLVENRSLILWTQYMLSCEVGTRDSKRIFVKFDDLLANPEGVLDRVETELDLQFPRRTWQSALEIQEFLRAEERHHRVDGPRPLTNFSELSRLYEFFEAASQGASLNADIAEETIQWLGRLEMTVGPVLKKAELELKAARSDADRTREEAASTQRELELLREDFARRDGDRDEQLSRSINDYEEVRAKAAAAEEALARFSERNDEAKVAELEGALSALRVNLETREAEFIERFNQATAEIRAANQRTVEAAVGSAEARRRVEELDDQLAQRTADVEELSGSLAAARERASDLDAAMASIRMQLDRQEVDFGSRLAEKVADAEDARRASESLAIALAEANAGLTKGGIVENELKRALSAATTAAGDATQALSEAKASIGRLDTEMRSNTARAANEIRSVQDQSAELARALSDAVIAREQLDRLSAAALMGRAVRRLFSRAR